MSITKNDLINDTTISCGVQRNTAKLVIEQFLNVVKDSIKDGNSLELRGFGTFSPKLYNPRSGRNIKTGELVPIAASKSLFFKFSPELKSKITGMPDTKAQAAQEVAKEPAQVRETLETHSL